MNWLEQGVYWTTKSTQPQLILDFQSLQGRVENKEPQEHPKYK